MGVLKAIASHTRSLLLAQEGRCYLCAHPCRTGLPLGDPLHTSIDHVWPLKRGGYDGIGNVLVAHKCCNEVKSGYLPTGCELLWLHSVCQRRGDPMRVMPNFVFSL